jgi:hypothetical protein
MLADLQALRDQGPYGAAQNINNVKTDPRAGREVKADCGSRIERIRVVLFEAEIGWLN